MSPLDRCAHLNRWRLLPLGEKALLAGGMLLLSLLLPPWPAAALVWGVMTLATLAGAKVPVMLWLRTTLAPAGFISLSLLPLILDIHTDGIVILFDHLPQAGGLAGRALAATSCLLFLAMTTPAPDLLGGLCRLGVPADLADIALLLYRFIFLLDETARRLHQAQAARLGHETLRGRLRCLGLLIAALLPQALHRARRQETGLAARGWDGALRLLSPLPAARITVLLGIAVLEALLAGLCLLLA